MRPVVKLDVSIVQPAETTVDWSAAITAAPVGNAMLCTSAPEARSNSSRKASRATALVVTSAKPDPTRNTTAELYPNERGVAAAGAHTGDEVGVDAGVPVLLPVCVGEAEGVPDGEGETDGVFDSVAPADWEGELVCVVLPDGEGVDVPVCVGVLVAVGVGNIGAAMMP